MSRSIRTYLTGPLCLLFVAGLILGGNGSVLCVGDDGFLKVEPVCQPCVSDSGEICKLSQPDAGHDHQDECASCTDLPLDQNSISLRPNVHNISAAPVQNISLASLLAPIKPQISRAVQELPNTDSELPSARIFLATIVLRC